MQQALSQEQHLVIPANEEELHLDLSALSSWDDNDDHRSESSCSTVSKAEILSFLKTLPRNLHKDKMMAKAAAAAVAVTSDSNVGPLDSLQEGIQEEDEDEEESLEGSGSSNTDPDAGLKIAWQYRTSVQRERLGHASTSGSTRKSSSSSFAEIFCHSYDLQGRLHDQIPVERATHIPVIPYCKHSPGTLCPANRSCGFAYFRELLQIIQPLLLQVPHKVVRLLLYQPNLSVLNVALPLLLAHIRTHRLPVVVMIAVRPWTISPQQLSGCFHLLRRASDVILTTEGFAARREYPPPPEFRIFHGLLHVIKTNVATAATAHGGGHFADFTINKRPAANLYGLKRDRRKLHIELLHIPPEDYAQGGGSVGSGGVRSGAGLRPSEREKSSSKSSGASLACASSGGGASILDF